MALEMACPAAGAPGNSQPSCQGPGNRLALARAVLEMASQVASGPENGIEREGAK
jgi:hypothetical protein